jgi:cytochrome c oxidase accessory protein FixG
MREQVCTYMCPWPRIQGAMLDEHSLQVTYRYDRGEPRAPHKKGQSWEGRGDCVDCNQCVVVCPMGIDIRNGPQLECINCGLCIDACDEIMLKVGRPKGLIAFDSVEAVTLRAAKKPAIYKYVRPRTIYYAVALAAVSSVMLWGLMHRSLVDLHVLRDRNPTFVRLHDGAIRDGYTLKIGNRSFQDERFTVGIEGLPAVLKTPGEASTKGLLTVIVPANEVRAVRVFATAPKAALTAPNMPVIFTIRGGGHVAAAKTIFLSGNANQ